MRVELVIGAIDLGTAPAYRKLRKVGVIWGGIRRMADRSVAFGRDSVASLLLFVILGTTLHRGAATVISVGMMVYLSLQFVFVICARVSACGVLQRFRKFRSQIKPHSIILHTCTAYSDHQQYVPYGTVEKLRLSRGNISRQYKSPTIKKEYYFTAL